MIPKKKSTTDLTALVRHVTSHVVVNNAQLDGFPLILSVVGPPGIGKTFNIRETLKAANVRLFEISSSALAHHREGMVLYPLIRAYRDAAGLSTAQPVALMIDDFDRSIASGTQHAAHTIHSQLLTGFLMDLCDNPYSIPDEGTREMCECRRVPIIMTGNDMSQLDQALLRPQRMRIIDFNPTDGDKIAMMRNAFATGNPQKPNPLSDKDLERLASAFRGRSIAFFSDIAAAFLADTVAKASEQGTLPSHPNDIRRHLQAALLHFDLRTATEIGNALDRSTQ